MTLFAVSYIRFKLQSKLEPDGFYFVGMPKAQTVSPTGTKLTSGKLSTLGMIRGVSAGAQWRDATKSKALHLNRF
jgi:hypothetical protein